MAIFIPNVYLWLSSLRMSILDGHLIHHTASICLNEGTIPKGKISAEMGPQIERLETNRISIIQHNTTGWVAVDLATHWNMATDNEPCKLHAAQLYGTDGQNFFFRGS